ncbi:MAG: restriction endonuclease subunit S, partial [Treponema sp.]|nr:restriction endonuclease subunit S [Treponema sp.]
TLYDIPILAPDLDSQHKIGDLLSKIDRKISVNREINRNLEELAKQIYDYWFLQFDFPNEDGKPYKSSGGKMVWNEILKRDIPAGWNCFEMQNICNISRGASPRPIEAYMDTTNTGIPWIKISDATEDIESPYLLKIKDCIIPEGKEKSVSVKPDTLIVSNSATPGIPKFVELNACVHDGWLVLDKYDSYYKYYLFYVIKMVRYNLLYLASGSIFKNLKTDYLKTLPTLVPDIKILQRFDEKIERIMKHILKTEREINELIELRDNLLPLLMNGQVTLNSCLSHD